jgi:hypothetical protein
MPTLENGLANPFFDEVPGHWEIPDDFPAGVLIHEM